MKKFGMDIEKTIEIIRRQHQILKENEGMTPVEALEIARAEVLENE